MTKPLYDYKPTFCRATFEFTQDGNTLGSTADFENLGIFVETQLPNNDGDVFLVLKSDTGWSFDNIGELTKLVNQCLLGAGVEEKP